MNFIYTPDMVAIDTGWPYVMPTHRLTLEAIAFLRAQLRPLGRTTVRMSLETRWHLWESLRDFEKEWADQRLRIAPMEMPRHDFIQGQWERREPNTPEFDAALFEDIEVINPNDEKAPTHRLRFRRLRSFLEFVNAQPRYLK